MVSKSYCLDCNYILLKKVQNEMQKICGCVLVKRKPKICWSLSCLRSSGIGYSMRTKTDWGRVPARTHRIGVECEFFFYIIIKFSCNLHFLISKNYFFYNPQKYFGKSRWIQNFFVFLLALSCFYGYIKRVYGYITNIFATVEPI